MGFQNATVYASGYVPEATPMSLVDKDEKLQEMKTTPSYAEALSKKKIEMTEEKEKEKKEDFKKTSSPASSSSSQGTDFSYASVVSTSLSSTSMPANTMIANAPADSTAKPSFKNALLSVPTTSAFLSTDAKEKEETEMEEEAIKEDDEEAKVPSLGYHLINLMEFFGVIFNYQVNGISIRNGGFIYRIAAVSPSSKAFLSIEDPIHPSNNVGASTFALDKIITCFEDAFYALSYFQPSRFMPTALGCLLNPIGHPLVLDSPEILSQKEEARKDK